MRDLIKSIILFGLGVFILSLFSCEQEEIVQNEPECSCYEVNELLEPVNVNGLPTLQWIINYETAPLTMPCSSETAYYYNNNNTERWRTVCQ